MNVGLYSALSLASVVIVLLGLRIMYWSDCGHDARWGARPPDYISSALLVPSCSRSVCFISAYSRWRRISSLMYTRSFLSFTSPFSGQRSKLHWRIKALHCGTEFDQNLRTERAKNGYIHGNNACGRISCTMIHAGRDP